MERGWNPSRALTVKYLPDIKSVTQRRGRIGRQAVVAARDRRRKRPAHTAAAAYFKQRASSPDCA
jgi:hypothetical protein